MLKKALPVLCISIIVLSLCACKNESESQGSANSKTYNFASLSLKDSLLTPETLLLIPRIGNVSVSPNGEQILFTVSNVNIDDNKSYTNIYTLPVLGGQPKQITNSLDSKWSITWSIDGTSIYFLSSVSGKGELFKIEKSSNNPMQISRGELDIIDYKFAPTEKQIILITNIKIDKTVADIYPDLPKANARIENDVMYRHWDEWEDGLYSHIILSQVWNNEVNVTLKDIQTEANSIDLLKGEPYDVPMKPFGDIGEVTWSPDGTKILYTCKKLSGKAYATSTNSDIYQYDIDSKATKNLTEGMMGYDKNPIISPDGTTLAWESMERNGYEADKNRLFIMNLSSGEKTDITNNFDQNVANVRWDCNNKQLWFTSQIKATEQIYKADIATKQISKITTGIHDYNFIDLAQDCIIGTKTAMNAPSEIFKIDPQTGKEERLTFFTNKILDKVKMGKVEERWIKTTDGKEMLTWVIYPPNFNPNKKYPTLLYCQGGPQDAVSQFWSIRWNFQLMAANGYIVVAPNRRGLPSFGQAWNEQISGDYGGQNMLDYFSAIDAMAKEPFVDATKLGAIGASYGGFSIYWIAGNHNKRFKAFIAHCGIFNLEQMFSTTEESFFTNFDLKGAYWDKNNAAAQKSYSFSPHKFVQNWDTPILVIHGAQDFRIPEEQGMGAFNSAILKGIPARFLYFPNENHWVLSPQNGLVWHREFYKWLDKWLK